MTWTTEAQCEQCLAASDADATVLGDTCDRAAWRAVVSLRAGDLEHAKRWAELSHRAHTLHMNRLNHGPQEESQ